MQEAGARFALASARERAAALEREVRRLQAKDFAFDLPRTILKVIEASVRSTIDELAQLEEDRVLWHTGTPLSERLDTIRTCAAMVEWLHDSLAILDKVDSARLPFEAVRAFESTASQLLQGNPPVQILLHPQREFDYGLLDLPAMFEPVGDLWKALVPEQARAFALYFPAADSSAVLMHTLFLHEIGHALFKAIYPSILEDLKKAVALADRELDKEISESLSAELKSMGFAGPIAPGKQRDLSEEVGAALRSAKLDEAAEVIASWVEEVACDICGTRLAGPAYLCAFQAFFLPFLSSAEGSESHPDIGLRLKIIERCLERDRLSAPQARRVLDAYGPHATPIQGLPPVSEAQNGLKFRIARHVLRAEPDNAFAERLLDEVSSRVPNPLAGLEFAAAVLEGVDQLDKVVPPTPFIHAETRKSFTGPEVTAFVLHCCWIFKLNGYGEWRSRHQWLGDKCDEVLNQLALKALEAADLERRYHERPTDGIAKR